VRIVALAVVLAAGCSNTTVVVGGGAPPVSSTVVTSGATGLTVTTTSGAAALALILTIGAMEYARNPQPFPNPSTLLSPNPPAPELAANRRISEQDCSKPVDLTLGNLRCK
jgi:hypothetical protein